MDEKREWTSLEARYPEPGKWADVRNDDSTLLCRAQLFRCPCGESYWLDMHRVRVYGITQWREVTHFDWDSQPLPPLERFGLRPEASDNDLSVAIASLRLRNEEAGFEIGRRELRIRELDLERKRRAPLLRPAGTSD